MEIKYYDLTSGQMILFYSQMATIHKQVNNICTSVLTDTELNFDTLREAVEKAYERNDSFRIRIVKVDKKLKQYFAEHEPPAIEYLDFRGKTKEAMEKKLYKIAHKPVTVFGKPMSKVYLMHSCDGRSGLYFVVSHLILDSWAITSFFRDVLGVYMALANGTELPPPPGSYEKLFIEELNYRSTEAYKKDREYWQKRFSESEPIFTHVNGPSVLEAYRKKHKNPNLRYGQLRGLRTKANNVMLMVPKELVEKANAYCIANNVPLQSVVLLAWRSYFSKVNNNEKDIAFNTVLARRATLKEKNTGGSRVHFMPCRTVIEESETFKRACEIISEEQVAIFRHGNISPLEVMGMWKKAYNVPRIGTYYGSTVTFQPVKLSASGGINIETKWYGNGAAGQNMYLTVMDGDGAGGLKFYYEYQVHNVSLETIKKLHSYMLKAMEAGIGNDQMTIGELLKIE